MTTRVTAQFKGSMMSDPINPSPPAGWYPAPHAGGELRYWDGTQWPPQAPPPAPATAIVQPDGRAKPPTRKKLRWWMWLLIVLAALIILGGLGRALGNAGSTRSAAPAESPAASSSSTPTTPAPQSTSSDKNEVTRTQVPDVGGMTTADAIAAIEAAGLTASLTGDAPGALIVAQSPRGGATADSGATVSLTAEVPAPVLTLGQKNAVRSGEQYLRFSAFSRQGLIDQLLFENYSVEDATFAVDHINPDWNEQAAKSADAYIKMMSFSRQSLIDQLIFEGFCAEQAEFGATAVGY